jgi:hypothetical protein
MFKNVRISLVLLVVLLAVAFVGIMSQHGHATRITWLSLAPLGLYLLFWAIAAIRVGGKNKSNLNSCLLLLLLDVELSDKASVLFVIAFVAVALIGNTIANASVLDYEARDYTKPKWYRNPKFALLPILRFKQANEHNTSGFQFDWLFLRLWSLDAFGFEFGVVADNHWGVGVIGILPYLRWTCCIPCPERVGMWFQANLWRRPAKVREMFDNLKFAD